MNSLIQFLPILLASFAAQERTAAVSELTALLTSENSRVNGGLTSEQIAATVNTVVTLAFAEQNTLVSKLMVKLSGSK